MADEQTGTRPVSKDDLSTLGDRARALTPMVFPEGDAVASVKAEWSKVKATVVVDDAKKEETRDYIKLSALNTQGCTALSAGDQVAIVKHFNYGFDLSQRSNVRARIIAAHEDPMKAINNAAKAMAVALGISVEAAKDQVIEMKKAAEAVPAEG
tara:strand:- start:148 stop:609 length:462 start_codon:yes stop_codon:yes gene_type:complete